MAAYYVKGAPVVVMKTAGDAITGGVRLRGYSLRHTASGHARLVAGSAGTTTNAVFHAVLAAAGEVHRDFDPPIALASGCKLISLTGTELLLYV